MSNHGPAECLQQYIGCECILFCNVERPTARLSPDRGNIRKKNILERSIETYGNFDWLRSRIVVVTLEFSWSSHSLPHSVFLDVNLLVSNNFNRNFNIIRFFLNF